MNQAILPNGNVLDNRLDVGKEPPKGRADVIGIHD